MEETQQNQNGMIMQFIRLKSDLSEEELLSTARQRENQFRAIPGLLQKYYVKTQNPGEYGGVYIWDSMESLQAFRASDLAASIPSAYKVIEAPKVEVLNL